jgi:hypothetical protein
VIKILMILVVALVSTIATDAVAQTRTCARKDPATRAYWPTFGYIPGGPYVYVPPSEGSCHQVRRPVTSRGRRSRVYLYH